MLVLPQWLSTLFILVSIFSDATCYLHNAEQVADSPRILLNSKRHNTIRGMKRETDETQIVAQGGLTRSLQFVPTTEETERQKQVETQYEFETNGLVPTQEASHTPSEAPLRIRDINVLEATEKNVNTSSMFPSQEPRAATMQPQATHVPRSTVKPTFAPSSQAPTANPTRNPTANPTENPTDAGESPVASSNNDGTDETFDGQEDVSDEQEEESQSTAPPSGQYGGEGVGDNQQTDGEQENGPNYELDYWGTPVESASESNATQPPTNEDIGLDEQQTQAPSKVPEPSEPVEDEDNFLPVQAQDSHNWTVGPEQTDQEETTTPQQNENNQEGTVPDLSSGYYYVRLRPFSVFVEADRDLTSDLGIPLYLLLEMEDTLASLVDIKILNLTIHMGVVRVDDADDHAVPHQSRVGNNYVEHYHWNQLYFQGVAECKNGVPYSESTVQNVQSLVLSNKDGLQAFWDNESREIYSNLNLVNITLLEPPATEGQTGDESLLGQQTEEVQQLEFDRPDGEQEQDLNSTTVDSQQSAESTTSKRDSNVWVMVPLVLLFLLLCLCIIALAGRLRYLSSRAQERYNEKYGLDYNIYDKDISKDIFNEEYLMSEHEVDHSFSHNSGLGDSVRSIDFLTRPISTIKSVRRSSKAKQIPASDDMTPTTDDEEDMHGSGEVREVFSNEGQDASFVKDEPVDETPNDNVIPKGSGLAPPSVPTESDDFMPRAPEEVESQDERQSLLPNVPDESSGFSDDAREGMGKDDDDVVPDVSGMENSCSTIDRSTRSVQSDAASQPVAQDMSSSSRRERSRRSLHSVAASIVLAEATSNSSGREGTSRSSRGEVGNSSGGERTRRSSHGEMGNSSGRERSRRTSHSEMSNSGGRKRNISRSSRSDMSNASGRERSSRSIRSVELATDGMTAPMEKLSEREQSTRGARNIDPPGAAVMGNSSGRELSTRSNRSIRSMESMSSAGSFYSCQGDLV